VAIAIMNGKNPAADTVPALAALEQASPASAPASALSSASKPDVEVVTPARAEAIEHYNKGNRAYLERKFPQAIAEFKRALESDRSFAYAHRGLGVTYAAQRKGELAIEAYRNYLKLAPNAKDAKQVENIIKNFDK
jgi:tetratricopeptide (TPR) repeat protein